VSTSIFGAVTSDGLKTSLLGDCVKKCQHLTPQHTTTVGYQTSGGAISSPNVWSVKAIGSINEDQQITHRESGGKHMRYKIYSSSGTWYPTSSG
jgi:hypothetical protein